MFKQMSDLKCGDLFRIYDKHKYYFVEIPEVRFNSSSVAILIILIVNLMFCNYEF